MEKNIKAKIVADSLSPQGNRLTTFVLTFPRIVLAELNTHRMFSRNSASSRAIPFEKMVKSIEDNPFIPIAFQKDHKGMQGNEYITNPNHIDFRIGQWLNASKKAIASAKELNGPITKKASYDDIGEDVSEGITKQLCNRLLEPFMWHTVILTTSEEGLENFFKQRCPVYDAIKGETFRSKKDAIKYYPDWNNATEIDWLIANSGQAEIHISLLAEYMWDAYNESTPRQLQVGDWHIPFDISGEEASRFALTETGRIKIAVARAARISYTVVGEDKEHSYEDDLKLHDRLIAMYHLSPLEHICRAMSDKEYETFVKGEQSKAAGVKWAGTDIQGWCNNLRGFIPYRYMIENKYV